MSIVTHQPDAPVYIRAYETSFAQVLRNLIDNAITFSSPKDQLRLDLNIIHEGHAQIILSDQGPGIPPDNLETIFDRFYTKRPEGADFGEHSGLGLAISRQIVNAHNGTIRAENIYAESADIVAENKVEGARFIITLPLVKDAEAV